MQFKPACSRLLPFRRFIRPGWAIYPFYKRYKRCNMFHLGFSLFGAVVGVYPRNMKEIKEGQDRVRDHFALHCCPIRLQKMTSLVASQCLAHGALSVYMIFLFVCIPSGAGCPLKTESTLGQRDLPRQLACTRGQEGCKGGLNP